MEHRTLSIGGATYDLFVRLPKGAVAECNSADSFALPLGAKIRVENLIETCGGGASNTSVGLARLGCSACYEGVLSADQWGEKLMQNLQKEGVDTSCITVVEDEVSSYSIILSGASGERVILYEPGTNKHLHDANFDKEMLQNVDWVYLNHIQEGSCIIQDDISEMLATDSGPRLAWNPGGCQIDAGIQSHAELLKHTELLIVNKEEALKLTETSSIEDALRAILSTGASNVCITDGGNGTVASDGVNIYTCPVMENIEIVDTTGAGDAFGTGVTWGLMEGMILPEALKTGSINAASVVASIGAQTALLTDTEIRSRLKECSLDVSSYPLL
jgi:ribokinase